MNEVDPSTKLLPLVPQAETADNLALAQTLWPNKLTPVHLSQLQVLAEDHGFSVSAGDLLFLDKHWYVSHSGLLRLAVRHHCAGIHVRAVPEFCDPVKGRWTFKATVYKSRTCRGFAGFGDADSANTSALVRGAEMRVAETRAVNRALRKAYGIGICSIEEIGATPANPERPVVSSDRSPNARKSDQRLLRDEIQALISRHHLDPSRVRLFAADYCDVKELRQASREQLEEFARHLADYAEKDREGLLCQLNSYGGTPKP